MDSLHRAILSAMEQEVSRITEEEAKKAAARVEERVRGLAGEVATKIDSWVCYEPRRDEVLITVKLPERPTP